MKIYVKDVSQKFSKLTLRLSQLKVTDRLKLTLRPLLNNYKNIEHYTRCTTELASLNG